MIEPKVRLNMVIPGATMLSELDCSKMSKKEAYNYSQVTVEYKTKKGKKLVNTKETFSIYTRKSKPARQSLSISKEAYLHMTDRKEIPAARFRKSWATMSKKERLEYHLTLIAENFNAISYSYEILED